MRNRWSPAGVAAFRRLLDEAQPELRSYFEDCLHYAKLHHDLISRFGRFPHRNQILGRDGAAAEIEYQASAREDFAQ